MKEVGVMKGIDFLVDAFVEIMNENEDMRITAGKEAFFKFRKEDPMLVAAVYGLVKMGEDVKAGIDEMIKGDENKPDKFRVTLIVCMADYFKSVMRQCDCQDCKKWRAKYDTKTG